MLLASDEAEYVTGQILSVLDTKKDLILSIECYF